MIPKSISVPYQTHFRCVHYQCHVIKTKQFHNNIWGTYRKPAIFPNQGLFRVTMTKSFAQLHYIFPKHLQF